MSERNWPETVEVNTNDLHDLMRILRRASMLFDIDGDMELAAVYYNGYLHLLKELTEKTGGEYNGQYPMPFGTEPKVLVRHFTNENNPS